MSGEPTVTVIGRLGKEPDLRFTKEGKSFASFSVACTPRVKTNDEWKSGETIWFKVTLWKDVSAFMERATKGSAVIVTGKMSINTYETKTGETKTELIINPDGIGFIETEHKHAEPDPWQ